MACSETTDCIPWSDETYTLREVATKVGLPTLVKVSEGLYSDNEAETFSCGDLLKLEFVKSLRKVSAKLIGNGAGDLEENIADFLEQPLKYDTLKDDILIPLGYKGLVKVIKPHKDLYTVDMLMEEFPKDIRTETTVSAQGKVSSATLPAGENLEIDRIIPNKGIICRYKNKELLVKRNQNAKFSSLANERNYTLEEVVEYFQFPQYVRFVGNDFAAIQTSNLDEAIENIKHFTGILQLTREVIQNVVVGHHKPSGVDQSKSSNRSLALLPLDSISEQMIVFNVPIYSDPIEYQLVMARNFSQDVDMSSLDGVLYLEFAKDPKVHIFRTEDEESNPRRSPPIELPTRKSMTVKKKGKKPEKANRKEKKKTNPSNPKPMQKKVTQEDTADDDHEEDDPYDYPDMPKIVPGGKIKDKKSIRRQIQSTSDINIGSGEQLTEAQIKLETEHALPTIKETLQMTFAEVRDKFPDPSGNRRAQGKGRADKQKTQSIGSAVREHQSVPMKEYDYPDVTGIQLPRPVPRQMSGAARKHRSIASVMPSVSADYANVSTVAAVPRQRTSKTPDEEQTRGGAKRFASMTVEEASKCLKACGLTEVARVCERELLDGTFLCELSSEELEKELFSLTPIQMKKLERVKKGWIPKTEKSKK